MADLKFINDPSSEEDAHRDHADALSLRLHHLKSVTELAAFAAEARRALGAFEVVTEARPAMQSAIRAEMNYPNAWREYDDVTGDVLQWVAQQLGSIATEVTEFAYPTTKGETA